MSKDEAQATGHQRLSYKYQRLRERLREAILSGQFNDQLPGERTLGKMFHANAKTINKALSDLALEDIVTRQVGRGTFVKSATSAATPAMIKPRVYGWFMPGLNGRAGQALYNRAVQKIENHGHRLEALMDSPHIRGTRRVNGMLERLRNLAGLVLFAGQPSPQIIAELHRRHIPLVLANNIHPTLRTSVVLPDYAHGAFDLTHYLIQLGHRNIGLVVDADLMPAADSAERGYTSAMQRHGLKPSAKLVFSPGCSEGRNATDTAFLCVGQAATEWMATELGKDGLKIPEQVSLVAILEPGALSCSQTKYTAYEVDVHCMVDWAAHLLLQATPGQQPHLAVIPGRIYDRGSAAVPPGGCSSPLHAPTEICL